MFNKRAISGVVESILLILLVVVAIGIIVAFVVPFVNNNLDEAGTCIQTLDQVKLNAAYTCYYNNEDTNDAFRQTGVLVNVETEKIELDKIVIILSGAGESKSVEITDGMAYTFDVNMYKKPQGTALEIPGENEGKTYWIPFNATPNANTITYKYYMSKIEQVRVAPVLDGKQCDVADQVFIAECPEGV